MKYFSEFGVEDFIICGGYKVDLLKEYFMNYYIYQSDITVDLQNNSIQIHKKRTENWRVTVVDTGIFASTGQRIARIEKYLKNEDFLVTYGDCLSDIDIDQLMETHRREGKVCTLAAARPSAARTPRRISTSP